METSNNSDLIKGYKDFLTEGKTERECTLFLIKEAQKNLRLSDKPITKKPADVRMGKGKGDPVGFVVPVTPGRIIFEVDGVSYEIAKEALRLAAQKLPILTKFVIRRDYDKNA